MAWKLNTETLARASSRHPWRTIAGWVVGLLVMGFVAGQFLAGVLSNEFRMTNRPDSERALELIGDRLLDGERQPEFEPVIVRSTDGRTVEDPGFRAYVTELAGKIAALGEEVVVPPVLTAYEAPEQVPVSEDGDATMLLVQLEDFEDVGQVEDLREALAEHGRDGFQTLLAGRAALFADFTQLAEEDLRKGESIGIGVALIVLLVVFAALVAALLPILMAIFAIVVAVGLVAVIGQIVEFQFFVTNMITMIGLAVGIDYALFIVSRYREERRRGRDKLSAIEAAGATANRAVFFSGLTVVFALLGMLIIPTTIFRSLAAGAIFVVIASLLASMTLLPALLGLLGDRINWPRLSRRARTERAALGGGDSLAHLADRRGGFWDRVSRGVMAHPVAALVVGVGFMLAAASAYLGIHLGSSGVSTLPEAAASKEAFLVLQEEFGGAQSSPVQVVVDGAAGSPEVQDAVQGLRAAMAADPGFAPQTSEPAVSPAGDLVLVNAFLRSDPLSDEAVEAIDRLRAELIPAAFEGVDAEVLVGGDTAMNADFFDLTDRYTPIVFFFVLGLSFLLLTVVFRSIVVPVKAILMNLLSVFAAYGILTMVFQEGGPAVGKWIADLLNLQQVESIEAWLPLFLFSVLFGLSMDYHVFLLTRIREHFDHTGDNTESVAHGLRTTGGIITGAALIMVAVFGGFAAGQVVALSQMGFGLAVAVFFDATVVRSILVPASMKLLGNLNWYLPKWLRWLPDLKVEGHDIAEDASLPEPAGIGS
ncbi:MAG: MMPL family transporter [Actinobacteria bacterium]|nr:MMPL family transporter [Actinomycetota bacterium]